VLALLRLASLKMVIQLLVELLAGTRRNLERSAVTHELHHISRAIQDSGGILLPDLEVSCAGCD